MLGRKNIYIIALIFIFLFFYGASCATYSPKKNIITKNEALSIANKFLKKLDYNLKEYNVEVSEHDKPWNSRILKDNTSPYHTERRKKLENKVYWSVDYSPIKVESKNKETIIKQYGGTISVFIEKNTGDILTTYFGE